MMLFLDTYGEALRLAGFMTAMFVAFKVSR